MEVKSNFYQSHSVFDDLEFYMRFYEGLAFTTLSFLTSGTKSVVNIDSYTYSSMQGTIDSISKVLRAGRINDAYALLRKFYDSVIINIYTILYLKEHFCEKNLIVEQIQEWMNGNKQLSSYEDMVMYIRNFESTSPISDALLSDDRYKNIRDRCNFHSHYNFFRYVILNDNEISIPNRLRYLEAYRNDLRDLIIVHVAYTFFVNYHYMMSSDYVDALECGMQPETDSQYWVAPFVQKVFDKVVTPYRPMITELIRDASAMQIS